MKNYQQRGDVINVTAGAAYAAGAPVGLKHCVGIALKDIASGAVGPVALEGVFQVPKVTGSAWLAGEKLLWDVSAGKFDASGATPATGDIMGAAVAVPGPDGVMAASGDSLGYAKLVQGNTTLT